MNASTALTSNNHRDEDTRTIPPRQQADDCRTTYRPFTGSQIVLLITLVLLGGGLDARLSQANDLAKTAADPTKASSADGFQLPPRPSEPVANSPTFDLKRTLGKTGIQIAIGFGVLLIFALMFSKKRTARSLPREALEILGTVPLNNRKQIQLIRFGQKLVLVEASSDGLKPISELTDPAEVNQMLDLIRPRTP